MAVSGVVRPCGVLFCESLLGHGDRREHFTRNCFELFWVKGTTYCAFWCVINVLETPDKRGKEEPR